MAQCEYGCGEEYIPTSRGKSTPRGHAACRNDERRAEVQRTPAQYAGVDIQRMVDEAVARALAAANEKPDYESDQSKFEDGATVLASDIHIPLHNVKAFDALIQFVEQQPKGYIKRLVLAGDVFDGTNLSRFDKISRSDGHGGDLGDEMAMGRGHINALVRAIDGEHWIQSGNHELGRLHRALAAAKGIPAEPLEMEALLKFYEYDDRLKFHPQRKLSIGRGDEGTVESIHGEKYNKHTAATILADNLFRNISQGHTHRPQTFWIKNRFGHVNGHMHDLVKAGYAVDPDWTMGFTIFEHWDNGRKVNPYFCRIANNGSFSFAGKVYRG